MTLASPSLRRSATMACLAAACIGAAAQAAIVPITSNSSLSTENLGTFIGTLNYTFLGGTSGNLDVANAFLAAAATSATNSTIRS